MQTPGHPAPPADPAAPHPSRSVPVCTGCRHRQLSHGQATLCVHPATPIDLVSGEPMWRAYQMRAAGSACGPEGKLFAPPAPTPVDACPTCSGHGSYRPPFSTSVEPCPTCSAPKAPVQQPGDGT